MTGSEMLPLKQAEALAEREGMAFYDDFITFDPVRHPEPLQDPFLAPGQWEA
jgi:hypothetical protein